MIRVDNDQNWARHQKFLQQCVQEAIAGARAGAGGPFGALVVHGDDILAVAHNQVIATNDPTAHAEVQAIRAACQIRGTFQLDGCTLYTSCEPCPMCLGAIYWARPTAVFYAATRHDAAASGFDDAFIYQQLQTPATDRHIPFQQVKIEGAGTPFEIWRSMEDRVRY